MLKLNPIALAIAFSFLPPLVHATDFKGTLYERGSEPRKAIYKFTRIGTVKGNEEKVVRSYKDMQGNEVAHEDITFRDGKLVRLDFQQKQAGENGSARVEGNKIYFEYTKNGDTDKDDEKYKDETLISDQIADYLRNRWDSLMKGDTVSIRYVALSRAETVGFKFFKENEGQYKGTPSVNIKMKPSSFIIAALVDPLIFTFEKDGAHRLLEVDGRVVPMKNVDGKWKDLDAIFTLDY